MRDEAVDYALRLMWAGVATELHVFPGTCHGFDSLLPDWETSQRLFELQGAALRRALTSLNWSPRGCNAMARLLPISRMAFHAPTYAASSRATAAWYASICARVDHPEEAIGQRCVPVGLDGHGPGEERDVLAGLVEVVLDRHPPSSPPLPLLSCPRRPTELKTNRVGRTAIASCQVKTRSFVGSGWASSQVSPTCSGSRSGRLRISGPPGYVFVQLAG